jgi:hypothetical protein
MSSNSKWGGTLARARPSRVMAVLTIFINTGGRITFVFAATDSSILYGLVKVGSSQFHKCIGIGESDRFWIKSDTLR